MFYPAINILISHWKFPPRDTRIWGPFARIVVTNIIKKICVCAYMIMHSYIMCIKEHDGFIRVFDLNDV